MKIALLLCTVGWFYGSLLLCTAEDAKLSEHHPLSPPQPPQQPEQDDPLPTRSDEGALNRVSRAVRSFDDGGYSRDYFDEYNALRAATVTGPRRHRFLHFGRKRAAPYGYYGGLIESDGRSPDDGGEGGEETDDNNDWMPTSGENTETSASSRVKRSLREQSPNTFIHFGRRNLEEYSGGEATRSKRSAQNSNAPGDAVGAARPIDTKTGAFEFHDERAEVQSLDGPTVSLKAKRSPNRIMHFGKRIPPSASVDDIADGVKRASHNNILHFGKRTREDEVADALEHVYSSVDGAMVKRAGNRIMHFGKRGPEYGPSSGLDGEQETLDYDKRAPNRILHFGKRPDYNPEGDDNSIDKRSPLGHRIMHFGKREDDDVSGIMSSVNDEAVNGAAKRTFDARYKYADRLDQRPSVAGIEKQLQRKFQDWKKRFSHRILHFGKRDPEQHEQSPAYKRLGNRILHFGKRAGDDDSYSEVESPASTAKDKRLKHTIIHFGKREGDLESVMGGYKRNRIMHFGKRFGNDQSISQEENPVDKRAGNRILHFGKRPAGFDAPRSFEVYGYDIDDDSMDKRAHRILHFGKRLDGSVYDGKSLEASNEPPSGAPMEESDVGSKTGHNGGQPEQQHKEATRKKRSVPPQEQESNDEIDDTLAQMLRELIMDEDGYAKRMTMAHSGLSGPLHVPHAYVAAQVYGNVFPRMLSRPSRSDRLFRALYSGEHGADMKPKGAHRNVFLRFG